MTNIPTSAREFERWFREVSPTWPADLQELGHRAMLTLNSLDQPNVKDNATFMAASRADLMAFAEAYGAWAATKGEA